jgi:hypothetical protein
LLLAVVGRAEGVPGCAEKKVKITYLKIKLIQIYAPQLGSTKHPPHCFRDLDVTFQNDERKNVLFSTHRTPSNYVPYAPDRFQIL